MPEEMDPQDGATPPGWGPPTSSAWPSTAPGVLPPSPPTTLDVDLPAPGWAPPPSGPPPLADQEDSHGSRSRRWVYLLAPLVALGLIAAVVLGLAGDADDLIGGTGTCRDPVVTDALESTHIGQDEVRAAAPSAIYPRQPPTSGRHFPFVVASGVYDVAVDPRITTHNLEHGYVVIWLSPEASEDTVREVLAIGEQLTSGAYPKVVVARHPGPFTGGGEVSVTAWTVEMRCDGAAPASIQAFMEEHYDTAGEAPEKGLPNHVPGPDGVAVPDGDDLLLPPID